jgi:hypothetical protein
MRKRVVEIHPTTERNLKVAKLSCGHYVKFVQLTRLPAGGFSCSLCRLVAAAADTPRIVRMS